MKTNGYVDLIELNKFDPSFNPRLGYDQNTKIIYIISDFSDSRGTGLCPYFSENGKLCRYNIETKEIQEILWY